MDRWCYLDLRYYRYRLNRDFEIDLTRYGVAAGEIRPCMLTDPITSPFYHLTAEGRLTIRNRYAWDGPSGPTIDTPSFMRGSLVHDCLYQMIRTRQLDMTFRPAADLILRRVCEEDGMIRIRAWWVHKAVTWFGAKNARPSLTGGMPDEVCHSIPL